MKNTDVDKVTHPVKAKNIHKDDIMAFVYWAKVVNNDGNSLDVHNIDEDMDFRVQGKDLVERGLSADQFEQEIKVTKTRVAEILISSYNRPLTVCFEKLDGTERVLRGRLVRPEPLLGRSMVEDLDVTTCHLHVVVDHRKIKYLIVEGVKYEVKQEKK